MTDNPYQSPQTLERADANPVEPDAENRRGRTPWTTVPVGMILGCATVAGAGGLGGGLLGAACWSVALSPGAELTIPFICAIAGFFFGMIGGAGLGVIGGFCAGLMRMKSRPVLSLTMTILTGFYGAAVGLLGGSILNNEPIAFSTASMELQWPCTGAVIGAIAGAAGGWILAKLIGRYSWGQ
jgi:hypothetical protein